MGSIGNMLRIVKISRLCALTCVKTFQPFANQNNVRHNSVFAQWRKPITVHNLSIGQSRLKSDTPSRDHSLIQLFDLEEENLGVMKKNIADKAAKDKDCRLVLVDADSKPHPIYKLMTGAEYTVLSKVDREIKHTAKSKKPKTLRLNSTISEHDLQVKIKHIRDWLDKGQSVTITIRNKAVGGQQATAKIFKTVSSDLAEVGNFKEVKNIPTELVFTVKSKHANVPDGNSAPKLFKVKDLAEGKAHKS